uniref:Carbohydrate (N-acetylgalactosamine 4-0) sulfotransferase 8 n=1 Tax=Nothobranchius rachovii TaxID=451742 RepID=A0A1A8RPW4_9TELE
MCVCARAVPFSGELPSSPQSKEVAVRGAETTSSTSEEEEEERFSSSPLWELHGGFRSPPQKLPSAHLAVRHHGVDEGEADEGFPVWTGTEAALLLLVRPAVWCWRSASLHPPGGSVRDGPAARPRSQAWRPAAALQRGSLQPGSREEMQQGSKFRSQPHRPDAAAKL